MSDLCRRCEQHPCVCASLHRAAKHGRTRNPCRDAPWLRPVLPRLAQRLCAQLHDEDPAPLPEAYRGLELPIAVEDWHAVMTRVCAGAHPKVALRQVGVRESVFRALLRHEPRLTAWFARAKTVSKRRHQPSMIDMDAVLRELIRNPDVSARTACQRHGVRYTGFLARTRTPEWEQRYIRAKDLQRDQAFAAMDAEVTALGAGVTRATRQGVAQRIHALRRLEPRRFWPRKPLNTAAATLRDARRRVKELR
jgi:hypothetical protein